MLVPCECSWDFMAAAPQLERDALVAKTDVLERCLLTGKEEPLPSNDPSPTTSGGQPNSKASTESAAER